MGTKNPEVKRKEQEIILSPSKNTIKIKGKLFYSEGAQSWNIIRLRREVLHEFPELKEKSASFGYTMIVPKTNDEVKKAILDIEKGVIPILLFFRREVPEQDN